ncbi:MAG TPA: cysteine methyltransferase [Acidimicrobiaceae bacterium]|nr:cysteine methyltransferase [Acidimicrobiaceae bacterium]HCB37972.1 cysteine methyltransferase [Acidimicrobiaceae bacterium]
MTTTDTHYRTRCGSPLGELTLLATDAGLRAVVWEGDEPDVAGLPADGEIVDRSDHPVLAAAATQMAEYFDSRRCDFDVPLDLRGTQFQQAAWRALAAIPACETTTYAAQAARIGRPKAVRAVGSANGRNPVPIVLPCHRVVGSDGALTGYSGAGGLDTKQFLLDHEQKSCTADGKPAGLTACC